MIISRYPNSGQNQNIRIANELLENVVKFKYVGTIKFRECLLLFSPESFVFPSLIKKPKD
jgi:hypothetical protein